jgi:hypothetical protein
MRRCVEQIEDAAVIAGDAADHDAEHEAHRDAERPMVSEMRAP